MTKLKDIHMSDLPSWEKHYSRHLVLLRHDDKSTVTDLREVLRGWSGQTYVRRLHHRTQEPSSDWRKGEDHEEEIKDNEAVKHSCGQKSHKCPWFKDKFDLGGNTKEDEPAEEESTTVEEPPYQGHRDTRRFSLILQGMGLN